MLDGIGGGEGRKDGNPGKSMTLHRVSDLFLLNAQPFGMQSVDREFSLYFEHGGYHPKKVLDFDPDVRLGRMFQRRKTRRVPETAQ